MMSAQTAIFGGKHFLEITSNWSPAVEHVLANASPLMHSKYRVQSNRWGIKSFPVGGQLSLTVISPFLSVVDPSEVEHSVVELIESASVHFVSLESNTSLSFSQPNIVPRPWTHPMKRLLLYGWGSALNNNPWQMRFRFKSSADFTKLTADTKNIKVFKVNVFILTLLVKV